MAVLPTLLSFLKREGSSGSSDRNTATTIPTCSSSTDPTVAPHSSASTSATKTSQQSTSSPTPPTINTTRIIIEALRGNPFGVTSRSRAIEVMETEDEEKKRDLQERNEALVALAELFPDIKVEVFRELIVIFPGESRLQLCVEQLLRHRAQWVKGRWKVPNSGSLGNVSPSRRETFPNKSHVHVDAEYDQPHLLYDTSIVVPNGQLFRSEEYMAAVSRIFQEEFRSLEKDTITGVLERVNYSYSQARPILLTIMTGRIWGLTFGRLFRRRQRDQQKHPLVKWQRDGGGGDFVPQITLTGNAELDEEIYDTLVAPHLAKAKEEREATDMRLAHELNEDEARAEESLYECACCLSDFAFEQIDTCSVNLHVICFGCIQRTLHEALFGQGWTTSVNSEKSTLNCLAPLKEGTCDGTLDPTVVKRAIVAGKCGAKTYRKFEDRMASESLLKSQLKLIRCPFCAYAEVDPIYHPPVEGIAWRFKRAKIAALLLMVGVALHCIPVLLIFIVIALSSREAVAAAASNSLRRICLRRRKKRFACSNPSCGRVSCIICHKPWGDPHVCHESLLLSLRNTIEAARTAAIKRICPRCSMSFVKSTGCNKLTCICGYSMCYLCRKGLGPRLRQSRYGRRQYEAVRLACRHDYLQNQQGDIHLGEAHIDRRPNARAVGLGEEDDLDGADVRLEGDGQDDFDSDSGDDNIDYNEGEGYRHFCEHFRPDPGSPCSKCNKCELYKTEDEDNIVRQAGERAESQWLRQRGLQASSVANEVDAAQCQPNYLTATAHNGRHPSSVLPLADFVDFNTQLDSGRLLSWKIIRNFLLKEAWQRDRLSIELQRLMDHLVEGTVSVADV